jgi:soluble lytic murein transglycosylase-like protein
MNKSIALLLAMLAFGISVLWTMPWVQAPQAPTRITITEKEIQNDIQYQANLRAAKAVLARRGCSVEIPELATQAAMKNHIPVRIVAADIVVESSCNARAYSKAGAIGLMQIEPRVNHIASKRLWNPETNVELGTRILARNIHRYGYHGGLARYFGISQGSDASEQYAAKVLEVAYRR